MDKEHDKAHGRLVGKVAIITGGGTGIGEACCRLFAQEGASVVVAEINDATGQAVADAISAEGGRALFKHCDISVPEDITATVDAALEAFGTVDVLVNNAGIVMIKNTVNTSLDEWNRIMNVNLRSGWLFSKAVLPLMLERGSGSIVNISSIHAVQTLQDMTAYATSKGGVTAMTRAMALDHAPKVRVNAILPGYIATQMWQKVLDTTDDPEKLTEETIALQPMGRLGKPEDVAYAALFFACDESQWITGTSITVDGGISARFHN